MRHVVRGLSVIVAAGLLVLALPAMAANASLRVRWTSTVTQRDFESYCRRHGYAHAVLENSTAYGWECRTRYGGLTAVDVSQLCTENNSSSPHVVAWLRQNAYLSPRTGWSCRQLTHDPAVSNQPFGYQGDVSMRGYCQSRGYDTATLKGNTVNDWYCTSNYQRRADARVDLYGACRWQYEPAGRRSRSDVTIPMFDYNDPYSTACWS